MTNLRKTALTAALLLPLAPAAASAESATNIVTPIPPAEQVKIACLEGYEPVVTGLEKLPNSFAPGTGEVVTDIRDQGQNIWFVEVGVVGEGGQVYRSTEYGPHVLAQAQCRPAGSTTAEIETDIDYQ